MGNFDHFNRGQNIYFDLSNPKYDNDKALISLTINEYYNKYGVCMEYYATTYDVGYDSVWGEDNNRKYSQYFNVNGFFNLPKEDKVWSNFGIEGTDEIVIWISKRHFTATSINSDTGVSYERPQIGDIIKSDYSNYFYEITEVAEDTGQYLQSNQYIWELHARPMKNEMINTSPEISASDLAGIASMDDIFNIDNTIDIEKEEIIYNQEPNEKPNGDPFGNW